VNAAAPLLLVDDDPTFCDVMRRALNRRGFRVTLAHDVNEAWHVRVPSRRPTL
jgi:two-component system response regulator RegA